MNFFDFATSGRRNEPFSFGNLFDIKTTNLQSKDEREKPENDEDFNDITKFLQNMEIKTEKILEQINQGYESLKEINQKYEELNRNMEILFGKVVNEIIQTEQK